MSLSTPSQTHESNRRSSRSGSLSRWLGSLQLAVCSLMLFAAVLVLGTFVESWYDSLVAQQLVYGTWWFQGVLGLLGINIFFAALKKRPWKKHQTGFLITHLGLICLVTGGLVTSWAGTHGNMVLVDSPNLAARTMEYQTSNLVTDPRTASVRIVRGSEGEDERAIDFYPGPVAWKSGERTSIDLRSLTSLLVTLAHPWPRTWSHPWSSQNSLTVIRYEPHTQRRPYSPSEISSGTFPAVCLEFTSPQTGKLPPRWLADEPAGRSLRLGPALIEFLGHHRNEQQIREFTLPKTNEPNAINKEASIKAVLHLVTDSHNQLHYRSFHDTGEAGLRFEHAGTVNVAGDAVRIWKGMMWRFRVTEFIPRANAKPSHLPVTLPLGFVDPTQPPAVQCEFRHGGDVREFWLERSRHNLMPVAVGRETYYFGLNAKAHELDFAITLQRGEQRNDPGTDRPASQTCYVSLHDPSRVPIQTDHVITMNEPLVHRDYKFYLANLQAVGSEPSGRPIMRCTLTVGRDPGVRLKYAGALMVASGIACMFFMRAYPLRRRDATSSTPANDP